MAKPKKIEIKIKSEIEFKRLMKKFNRQIRFYEFDIYGTYKGEKFTMKIRDFARIQFSFPLYCQEMLIEIIPLINEHMQAIPVGYYDAECKNNSTKNFRSVLWNTWFANQVRAELANKKISVNEDLFADKKEKYIISKTGLCGGYKKTLFQICGQTNLAKELAR